MSLNKIRYEVPEVREYIMQHFDEVSEMEEFKYYKEGIRLPLINAIKKILQDQRKDQEMRTENSMGAFSDKDEDDFEEIEDEDDYNDEVSEESFSKGIEWVFDDIEANEQLKKARKLEEEGKQEEAKILFDSLLKEHRENTFFWPIISDFYDYSFPDYLPTLIEKLEEFYRQNPENFHFVFGLCEVLDRIGYDEEEKSFYNKKIELYKEKAIQIVSKNPENIEVLKRFYFLQSLNIVENDGEEKQKILEEIVRLEKKGNESYMGALCELYINKNDLKKGQEIYVLMQKTNPTNPLLKKFKNLFEDMENENERAVLVRDFLRQTQYTFPNNLIPEAYQKEYIQNKFPRSRSRNN